MTLKQVNESAERVKDLLKNPLAHLQVNVPL